MTTLYTQLGAFDLDYRIEGDVARKIDVHGHVHIPPLALWNKLAVWEELGLEESAPDDRRRSLRPVDRHQLTTSSYAMLDVRGSAPSVVHYDGAIVPLGLRYREWLELLFRARGARSWLKLVWDRGFAKDPMIARAAELFPDFDPASMTVSSRG